MCASLPCDVDGCTAPGCEAGAFDCDCGADDYNAGFRDAVERCVEAVRSAARSISIHERHCVDWDLALGEAAAAIRALGGKS